MEQQQLTEDEILDNFCHMVLEEYMLKRNLKNTLKTFREEWQRPKEVTPNPSLTFRVMRIVNPFFQSGYCLILMV